MSLRKSSESRPAPAGSRRKVPADRYTVFLVLALVAIIVAIVFLYLELSLYEFKLEGVPVVGSISSATKDSISLVIAPLAGRNLPPAV